MRNKIYQIILYSLIITICSSAIFAQLFESGDVKLYDEYLLDNELDDKYSGGYYVMNKTDSIKWQKPTVALFKSMLVPGWGQLGNRQYIKAGIIIGTEVTLIGTLLHYDKKTSDAKTAYDNASISGDDNLKWETFQAFDRSRDSRNLFSWITGTLIFLSMFDAYVDAHLVRFPKYDKRISLQINSEGQDELRAAVALKF